MPTARVDIKLRFGGRVRQLREELHLSQEELAFRAGLHRTYVSSMERGQRNVSLVNIERLADALEIATSVLFESEPPLREDDTAAGW